MLWTCTKHLQLPAWLQNLEQNILAEKQSTKEQHKQKDFLIYISDHFNKFQQRKDSTICHTKISIIWVTKVEPSKESLQLILMLQVFHNCSYFKLAFPLGKTLDCALLKGQPETHSDKLSPFKNTSIYSTKQALWFPSHSATPKYCSYSCRPVSDSLMPVLEDLRECQSKAQYQTLRIL